MLKQSFNWWRSHHQCLSEFYNPPHGSRFWVIGEPDRCTPSSVKEISDLTAERHAYVVWVSTVDWSEHPQSIFLQEYIRKMR